MSPVPSTTHIATARPSAQAKLQARVDSADTPHKDLSSATSPTRSARCNKDGAFSPVRRFLTESCAHRPSVLSRSQQRRGHPLRSPTPCFLLRAHACQRELMFTTWSNTRTVDHVATRTDEKTFICPTECALPSFSARAESLVHRMISTCT
jgi:hypothetical protein